MDSVRFIICIHNHQPVGNFDHVIEDAYQRAYLPFLEVMENHRTIPWVLHNSGCLWEWLENNHPEYIDRIGLGVTEGRIELIGGGFYEPVLPSLTSEDRRGQIKKMQHYLNRRFGVEARGIWLTERVWEPDLPADLVDSGVSFLPLDDTQLHQIGVSPDRIRGSFFTESAGRAVRIFPALMSLRYRIPYSAPEEAVEFLRDPFPGGGDGLALYADDGEKFGIWPGTYELLYKEKWLHKFLTGIESASDRIKPTTFTQEIADYHPEALVYLPTGSYAEMGEWSLPADYQKMYEETKEKLTELGMKESADLFIKGGFWRNFFARFPESSWMHMRALESSTRCRSFRSAMNRDAWQKAQDHFWRAQCNCAYWHGVFGGLYLPHLRHGIYAEIIRGESFLTRSLHGRGKWVSVREADLDIDGRTEIVLENDQLALFLDPDKGGRLLEWDDRSAEMNLVNVLSRRPENYHHQITEPADTEVAEPDDAPKTIHDSITSKEAGLTELLTYDWYDRAGMTDRLFDVRPDPQQLMNNEIHDVGDFVNQPYKRELVESTDEIRLRLWRDGGIWHDGNRQPIRIEKTIALHSGQRGYTVTYRYTNLSQEKITVWAAIENHFNLLAANASDRYLVADGKKTRPYKLSGISEKKSVKQLALVEGWLGWHIYLNSDEPIDFCRYPVQTVSLSEAGAEKNDQGLAVLNHFPLELARGEERVITLNIGIRAGLPEMKKDSRKASKKAAKQSAG